MTFPILGGNGAVAGYSIDNSLRFNSADSPYLSRTPASAGNRKTWTWSGWVKNVLGTNGFCILRCWQDDNNFTGLTLDSNGQFSYITRTSGSNDYYLNTTPLLRDCSAWYHFVFVSDTTQATASDRFKFYVNGVQITNFDSSTYPSQNFESRINNSVNHVINAIEETGGSGTQYSDAYLTETHFIDGQALSPTDFGEFDEDSGIWKPIQYTGSYGTNGFYLDFENSGSLGADQSGNGNDFTPTNLASTDQTTDSPTNNFATLNANLPDSGYNTSELSEGNLIYNVSEGNNGNGQPTGNMPVASGKWYWEIKFTSAQNSRAIGLCRADKVSQETVQLGGTSLSQTNATISLNLQDQQIIQKDESGTTTTEGSSLGSISNGDIFGHFLDLDNGTFQFYKNGSAYGSQFALDNLSSWNTYGALPTATGFTYMRWDFNFGNPPFTISSGNSDANGYGNFEYSPNDGTYNYLALCTQNLATALSPTIDDGSQYFNTVLYTGTGTTQSITGVGFQPDFVWLKDRDLTYDHQLHDSNRGASAGYLASNNTNTENPTYPLSSFDSDGWTTVSSGTPGQNASGDGFVAWHWKSNGGTTSSNTDGSITSTVQANTTAGFSIVTYTGNGTAGATIGHSLGVSPNVMIVKMRTDAGLNWEVYHSEVSSTPENDFLLLNQTSAKQTASNRWNNTAPTSSVFTVGNGGGVNSSGKDYVAYLFNNVEGYSKFGSYTGNGSTDGTFVYTGFRPAWVVSKRTDSTSDWLMRDTTRDTFNVTSLFLKANASNAEASSGDIDILSNGFKWRSSTAGQNGSGASYIYLAFAESPFVSSTAIPVTAR